MFRKLAYAGMATAALAGVITVAAPTTAQAAGRDGTCNPGEVCLYWGTDQGGSVSDFTTSIADYGAKQPSCYEFKGAGAGKGWCVKNHAESVWNRTSQPVNIYFNSNYGGLHQTVAAGAKANLIAGLKNDNASHRIGDAAPVSGGAMSYKLYDVTGGRLTCGFDGYTTTSGRHEGIDFARGIGSPVRALVEGKVINVSRGYRGRPGLSTIAVYNATYDKTVIYLHSAPLGGISVGQQVSRGQQIATEDWRGISSSSSAHTHVEMRPGYHTLAAKSVGDSHLDNPDPGPFWRARGYSVR